MTETFDIVYSNEHADRRLIDVFVPDDAGGAAVYFIHGDADDLIPLAESVEPAERINAAGSRAEVVVIEGAPHGYGYGVKTDHQKAALAHAERFLKEVL